MHNACVITNVACVRFCCFVWLVQALQQAPADTERSSEIIHDYHVKLSAAERARDEALVKLDSLQAAHQRLEAVYVHHDLKLRLV